MNGHSRPPDDWDSLRQRIIGLGEHSARKSYYPQLQRRLAELERFRALLDQSNDAIFMAEIPTGRFTDVNQSACQQLGYTHEELLSLTLSDLLSPAAREEIEALLAGTEAVEGEGTTITTALRPREGQPFPVEMTVRLVEFSDALYAVIVARDISERRRMEEALQESEERFAIFMEHIPAIVFIKDTTGRLVYVNQRMKELVDAGSWLGERTTELFSPALARIMTANDRRALDNGPVVVIESLPDKDGIVRVYQTIKFPIRSEGRPTLLGAIALDITERVKAEEARRKSEAQYRALLENIPVGIYRSTPGPRGEFLTANTAFRRIFGIESTEQLQEIAVCDLYVHPEERRVFSETLLEKGSVSGMELRMKRLDGVPIWGSVTARAVRDDGTGEVRYFDSAIEDITERKRVEEEVRRRAAHLEALNAVIATTSVAPGLQELLETALDRTLYALGLEQGVIWVGNRLAVRGLPAAMGAAGLREQEGGDLNLQGAMVVSDWEEVPGDLPRAPMLQIFDRFEIRASITVPIVAQGKRVGGLSVADRNIRPWTEEEIALVEAVGRQLGTTAERLRLLSEVRRHAEELSAAVSRLEELDRLKSQFIQNVSHELRTPLALIRGYAEMLDTNQLGRVPPEQEKPISIIARRARMLGELVEDITLILEAEANPPPARPVRLDKLAQAAGEDFAVAAARAGINLHTDIGQDLPPVVGSPTYLRRILDNLIGNAIKFTKEGGEIHLRLERLDEEYAILQVEDTGVGIPEDHLNRIFDRFYQVDGSARRRYGGVGLGLALVKEIVEVFGGRVRVESEVGRGSTFTIILPFAMEKEPHA